MSSQHMPGEDLDKARKIINDVLELNKQFDDSYNALKKLGGTYHRNLIFRNDIHSIVGFLSHITTKQNVTILLPELFESYPHLIRIYLKAVAQDMITPDDNIMQQLIKNFDAMYRLFFVDLVDSCIKRVIYQKYYMLSTETDDSLKSVDLEKTTIEHFIKYLPQIFQMHGNQMFKKIVKAPKKLFVFYFIFQEYLTDEMFETLCARMKSYKDLTLIRYIITCSRHCPQKYIDYLGSIETLFNIKNA